MSEHTDGKNVYVDFSKDRIGQRGQFITIEGGEGTGKTTLIARLKQRLEAALGIEVITTREPGGIMIAEQIRTILLDPKNTAMDGRTEALLYAAARRQHLVEKVIPALEQGQWVLCDRFIDSSLAYQGHARGLGIESVWSINEFAVEKQMPDMTLLLDLDPETGMARIHANEEREVNRLDMEKLSFHKLVREGYKRLLQKFPERIHVVDASKSPDEIADDAFAVIKASLL